MPPKRTLVKKTNTAIPKAGAKSVDPLKELKKDLTAKMNKTDTSATDEKPAVVDDRHPRRDFYEVAQDDNAGR